MQFWRWNDGTTYYYKKQWWNDTWYTIRNPHFTIFDWIVRCFVVPLGMSDYGNWNICTNPGLMAYASDLDILLHYQVHVLQFHFWQLHIKLLTESAHIWFPPFSWGRTKLVGPVVKLLLLIAATAVLIVWLTIGIPGSVFAGLVYGFLAPIMATFDAVGEGKEKPFVHCFVVSFPLYELFMLYLCGRLLAYLLHFA